MPGKKILIIFGGRSTEHPVAIISALHLAQNLNQDRYEVSALYIDQEGKPVDSMAATTYIDALTRQFSPHNQTIIAPGYRMMKTAMANMPPDFLHHKDRHSLKGAWLIPENFELVFPVFHGLNGEDGTIQGMLDFLNIPYTGCGVLNSAIFMDKGVTKSLCKVYGIPGVDFLTIREWEWEKMGNRIIENITDYLSFPIFVKPACSGSSIGITRAATIEQLEAGLEMAFQYNEKVIVEQGLTEIREIILGIMGMHDDILMSDPGEFNYNDREYFDFIAKYSEDAKPGIVPADISSSIKLRIEELALKIFKSFHLDGYARFDFFLKKDEIYLNEINTIPSLESQGTYMRAWQNRGISFSAFIDKTIELALKRYLRKTKKLYKTNFQSLL